MSSPAIRFAGFTEAWEERRFDEVFDPIQNNSLSRADLNYDCGEIKNIHYGDILIKYGAVVDCKTDIIPFITGAQIADYRSQLLQDGDVLIADAAEDEAVGRAVEMQRATDIPAVAGLHTIACRPNVKMQPTYLGYYINSPLYHKQLLPLMQGTKVLSVSRTRLANTTVCYPVLEQEQANISSFFTALDRLITLHQREHDKTVNIKKALLEKMFPKDGEDKPQIRFAGITGAWTRYKFVNCFFEIIDFRGRTPKKLGLSWSEAGYLALSALNVKDGFIDKSIKGNYGNQVLYDTWMKGKDLIKGQVLFTTEAPMGNVAQIPDNSKYILSQRTIAFRVNPEIIIDNFLAILLKNPILFSKFESLSSGGTAKGISQKSLSEVEVFLPDSLFEQAKIGTFFSHIGNLIALHQRELTKLQNIKKTLLERMFV